MCEPNFHLPQKINIDELRNFNGSKLSNASNKNLNFVPDEEKTGFSYISPIEYNVQPKYSNPYDALNTMLSVKYNDYLLCRWNAFLDKVPEKYVRIRLFVDYKKDKEYVQVPFLENRGFIFYSIFSF